MNRIKCLVAAAFLCGFALSCQQSKTPKSISADFVHALYGLDFASAETMVTSGGQDLLESSRKNLEARANMDEERTKRTIAQADASFETAAFLERSSGDEMIVQNNQLNIVLKKESGSWKVAATPELIDALVNHPFYLDEAKSAWTNLQQEYEKRDAVARQFVTLRMNRGERTASMNALDAAVTESMSGGTGATALARAEFAQRQDKLEALLDKGLEPAMNAGSDFSLNYIVQLSDAHKRIQEARKAYNDAARKARDKDYPVLP